MLYNDRAVQENHHISAAYCLLQDDDEKNIFTNLNKDDWRWARITLNLDLIWNIDKHVFNFLYSG